MSSRWLITATTLSSFTDLQPGDKWACRCCAALSFNMFTYIYIDIRGEGAVIKVVVNKETTGLAVAAPNMHAQHCHRLLTCFHYQ